MGVDLADIQLISKYNKGIRYLLCATDLSSKYASIVPLNNKKGTNIANEFQSILDISKRKPNKGQCTTGPTATTVQSSKQLIVKLFEPKCDFLTPIEPGQEFF